MDLTSMPLIQGFRQRFDWIAQNQSIIAGNIANADTANYKAREIEPFNLGMAQSNKISLRTTNAHHIALNSNGNSGASRINNSQSQYEISPSGNNVILEEQMIAAAENAMQHQLASNLYQKNMNMLRMVLQNN